MTVLQDGSHVFAILGRTALDRQQHLFYHVADRCGYSRLAVERTFRARYWDEARSVARERRTRGLFIER